MGVTPLRIMGSVVSLTLCGSTDSDLQLAEVFHQQGCMLQ